MVGDQLLARLAMNMTMPLVVEECTTASKQICDDPGICVENLKEII